MLASSTSLVLSLVIQWFGTTTTFLLRRVLVRGRGAGAAVEALRISISLKHYVRGLRGDMPPPILRLWSVLLVWSDLVISVLVISNVIRATGELVYVMLMTVLFLA